MRRSVYPSASLIADISGRFVRQPIDGETTRVALRESVPSTFVGRTINALMWDPMHFVMQQRTLHGIRERAEGQPLVLTLILRCMMEKFVLDLTTKE